MSVRRPLVAANWKMNGSLTLLKQFSDRKSELQQQGAEVVVCPPNVYLASAQSQLGDVISVGAQTLNQYDSGAYTGETSAKMLAEIGIEYVIVGHSERRTIYGETDLEVAAKFKSAQDQGLTPILCLGETLEQREQEQAFVVIESQLMAIINPHGLNSLDNAVIAYEPVWAIGTGKTATPEQAQEVHAFIRQIIKNQDAVLADKIRILYGGSVKSSNAAEIFTKADVDGGLIGGASLNVDEFISLCHIAAEAE